MDKAENIFHVLLDQQKMVENYTSNVFPLRVKSSSSSSSALEVDFSEKTSIEVTHMFYLHIPLSTSKLAGK